MSEDTLKRDIEGKLEALAEDPPTVEEAKRIFESSGRYDVDVSPIEPDADAESDTNID